MNRKVLDALAAHHGLTRDGVEEMLELAGARPSGAELHRFVTRMLQLAGVLSIAAGVVFFVAANWSAFPVFGRFALLHGILATAVGVALWRPPPEAPGRYALLFAFLVTGALFALYGQTYQTGADVYELFLGWALFGSVLVVAAQWSVTWAAWVLVLNVALWLFSGARPEAGLLWVAFSPWTLGTADLLVVPLLANALLWGLAEALQETPFGPLAPRWLGRFALACGVFSGTWAGVIVLLGSRGGGGPAGLVVALLVFAAVASLSLRRRRDVFPLAAVDGALIVLSTTWIAKASDFDEVGVFFVLAAWLIVVSTVSGRTLVRLTRRWSDGEAAP
jgi:uncharacterized membrane protein